jgi:nucleotide-binding universal stress UspA family protein
MARGPPSDFHPEEETTVFKHVLIPTDGSPVARKAVRAGVALARDLGAKVTAYYALEMIQPYAFGDGYILDTSTLLGMDRQAKEVGQKYLAEVEQAAKAAGVPCQTLMTKPETAAEGIIAAARKRKCDVIFMASHGRGGFASLLLGSVTQKVLARSKIPVLVYR